MAGHLRQLLVAIEEVEQLALSQDNGFLMGFALKVVEMRDHFQLEEMASTVHDVGVCATGLHLAVKRVELINRRCLDGSWVQAVLQIGTIEVELLEILLDLDRYCKEMFNAMLHNRNEDTCGQMKKPNIRIFIPGKYEGFQELVGRREEVADFYFDKVRDRLKKEIDAAKDSGNFEKSEFIACILQKLKNGMGTGGLLDIKWAEVVHGSYLGQGAFGYVMKSNLFEDEELALKNLSRESREAEIQATLQHPNIVQILCCLQSGKERFMVMELMSMDLRQFLKKKQQGLPLFMAIDVILQIARAMYYLHRQGIAHLDLKSSNVMVRVPDSPDGYVQVKLGDFGSAKIGLSAEVQDVGTARYRAPEISANPEGIERDLAKADVYSFALTCYHILTCQEPFAKIGDDHNQKKEVELGKRPQFAESCPSELVSLISRCWATDPEKRPDFETICNELQVVFTRFSGDITFTSGPSFIGERNVEALMEAPNCNLKYGIMQPVALTALELGKYEESQGQFEEALKKYNEAYKVQSGNVCILERRGRVKRKLGNLLEALDDFNEANKLDPKYGDVLLERGIAKWEIGDCVGACEDLDKFTNFQPERSLGYYMRGKVKHSLNLFEEALVDIDKAHNLGRKGPLMFFQRASTKIALGDYEGATSDYKEAVTRFDAIAPFRITPHDLCCRATSKAFLGNVQGASGDHDKAVFLSQYDPDILRARAVFKLSISDMEGAVEDSQKASESIYPSVDFSDLVFRGQVRSKSNDFHGTLEELNAVREHVSRNPYFWGFQAYYKRKMNDMQGALNDVEKANELEPDNALYLSWRGQIKFDLKDVEGASADFEKVRALDSGNVALIWNRAAFRSTLCDHDGALRDLNMVLEFDPSNWNALYLRGEAKRVLNDFKGALADYIEASMFKPGNELVWAQMGFIKQTLQYDSFLALADYSKAIDLQPLCALALKNRGILRGFLKDYVGSLEDLDIAHKLQPCDTEILTARAFAKSSLNNIQGAIQDYDKAVILRPNDPCVLRARAKLKLSISDMEGAVEDSQKASESIYPSVDFSDLVFRGQVRSKSNDFHGTLKELNAVREHVSRNPYFWGFQAYCKRKMNDMQGALNDVEKANELEPDNALYLSWRGQIKFDLKDVEGASADFEKVRALDSGNVALIWNRAAFRSTLCDHDGALCDLNMVLEFDPSNWNALYLRGEAKRVLNNFKGALADYTEARSINPSNILNLISMALVKERLNDIVGALADLNSIIDDRQQIHAFTYYLRGRMRRLLKDYAGSLEDLSIALKWQPYNALFLSERAHIKSKCDDFEGALEDQLRAMSLEPDGGYAYMYQTYVVGKKIKSVGVVLVRSGVRVFFVLLFLWIFRILCGIGLLKDPLDTPWMRAHFSDAAVITWFKNQLTNIMKFTRNQVPSNYYICK